MMKDFIYMYIHESHIFQKVTEMFTETNQFSCSPTLTECPIIQFDSNTNHLKLAQTPKLKAQSHETTSISVSSYKCQGPSVLGNDWL